MPKNSKRVFVVIGSLAILAFALWSLFGANRGAVTDRLSPGSAPVGSKAEIKASTPKEFSRAESRVLIDKSNMEMHSVLWAYRKIDPAAREDALNSIRQGDGPEERGGAFIALGYVGTNDDVDVIRDWIRSRHGVMSTYEQTCFSRAMESLGLMARRGIPAAKTLLRTMAHYDYWSALEMRWFPEDFPGVQPKEYEALLEVCAAMAIADDPELPVMVDRLLGHAKAARHPVEAERFRLKHIRDIADEFLKGEAEPLDLNIAEYLRRKVAELPTSSPLDTSQPVKQPATSERRAVGAETPEGRELEQQASAAFDGFEKAFLESDYASVANRLMDDMRPSTLSLELLNSQKFAPDLLIVRELLLAAKMAKCERTLKTDPIVIETSPSSDGNKIVETIGVVFVLRDSGPIVMKIVPAMRTGATFDRSGLLIQMRRINGIWYWNPFGW